VRLAEVAGLLGLVLLTGSLGPARAAGCTQDPDCDDTLYCNGIEECIDGECQSGVPLVIDDGIDCTIDRCNELGKRVQHTPDHPSCSDGLFCNGAERCQPLLGCRPGNPPPIDDGVDCTLDSCDEENGLVVHDPIDVLCHDGNECTLDVCDAVNGCTRSQREGPCDDGRQCTTGDLCTDGVCIGVPSTCGDGVAREGCSEECDDGNGRNWDGCDSACRIEGIPRLASELPVILDRLDRLLRDRTLGEEVRMRLAASRLRVEKALWWILKPEPAMYPVPPALAQLSRALGDLEGLHGVPELSLLIRRMLGLPRAIAFHRINVVKCENPRCQFELARARHIVRRGRAWERRGHLFRAADHYKDAWDWLDGQP
jgi:cysteine-rich repeat protein